jgi:parallel beta-helix repeat protein
MGADSAVTRCIFENDGTGVAAVQFCALRIADSVFRGNKTGIAAREFSTPAILHNLFERNGEAVNLFRKSHARVERNVFSHNRNAVVINYSSYPLVQGNNFDRNDMSVRLEKFQSGDWEERAGSPAITAGEAGRRGSRAMPAGVQPAAFPKRIAARGNWWGPDADRDAARGTLGKIWDGTKHGPVKYDGFGDAEFRIDVVDFSGEEKSPVKDAGPRAGSAGGGG